MKYNWKTNIFSTLLFLLFWIIFYIDYIKAGEYNNPDVFTNIFMSSQNKYNDSSTFVGYILTIIFLLSLNRCINKPVDSFIIRYGKDRFLKINITYTFIHAFLFSFEYWIVNFIFICFTFDWQILINSNFFTCSILYFLTRFLYFLTIAIFAVFIKVLFNYKKIHIIISSLIILAINTLPSLMINKGIILFAGFIDDWMQEGTFDLIDYVKNALICIIVSAILATAARLVFLKKDILINEEEN
ncbi:MAG: hypothetical protein ACLUFN_06415 [Eubacterium sp.]